MIYTKSLIKRADQETLKTISEEKLIDEVGKTLADFYTSHHPDKKKILILSGPGNNGAGGLAMAKHLKEHKGAFKVKTIHPLKDSNFDEGRFDLNAFDVIIDSVLGISINKNLPKHLTALFKEIENLKSCFKISIDMPTGVDADTGKIWGSAFNANETWTIGRTKLGLNLLPGLNPSGAVRVINIKSLEGSFNKFDSKSLKFLTYNPLWLEKIKPKTSDHKYSRGKTAFVMSEDFPGACLLAAKASSVVGSGYVQIYCPESLTALNQITHLGFVFTPYKNKKNLIHLLKKDDTTDVFCFGPGWTEKTQALYRFIKPSEKKFVLDGGALDQHTVKALSKVKNLVLTPHEGELKKLTDFGASFNNSKQAGKSRNNKTTTKWDKTKSISEKLLGVLVSKGYDTLIKDQKNPGVLSNLGTPFLAKAGTGDVLAGFITGLYAQGLSAFEASCFAVYIHSKLGHQLKQALTPEKMIANTGEFLNSLHKK